MPDDSKNPVYRGRGAPGTKQVPTGGRPYVIATTVEVAAGASAGSVYPVIRVPSNMHIMGASTVYFDDLASSGSPTIDFGVKAVDGNITTDADAMNDGVDVATAAGSASLIKDIANYGKKAWEFSSATDDPGGFIDITVSILDAATNTGGTITLEFFGYLD